MVKNKIKRQFLRMAGSVLCLFFLFSCAKKIDNNSDLGEQQNNQGSQLNTNEDYNYFYKVIIPNNKSLTRSEEDNLNLSMNKLATIFQNRLQKSTRGIKKGDSTYAIPAFVAASIFADYEAIGNVVTEINNQGSSVLFSHDALFVDNCIKPEGKTTKGISQEFRVYKYDHVNGLVKYTEKRNIILFRSDVNADNTQVQGFVVNNEEMYQNFGYEMVNQLSAMPDLNITSSQNGDNLSIKSNLMEMKIEYEDSNITASTEIHNSMNTKGFWKKIRQIATSTWNVIKKPVAVIAYVYSAGSCVLGNPYGCAVFGSSTMMLLGGYPLWDQPTILFIPFIL